jgi:ADP-heptose:LPS heptosyltransferase
MKTSPEIDTVKFRKWESGAPPQRILIIRFHAIGDAAACLASCNGFKAAYPDTRIDLLTGRESAGLMKAAGIFENVYSIPFHRSRTLSEKIIYKLKTKALVTQIALKLKENKYNAVIDLQHSTNSVIARRVLNPICYAEFDRYSPIAHSKRVLDTFRRAGFENVTENFNLKIIMAMFAEADKILK